MQNIHVVGTTSMSLWKHMFVFTAYGQLDDGPRQYNDVIRMA